MGIWGSYFDICWDPEVTTTGLILYARWYSRCLEKYPHVHSKASDCFPEF